MSQVYSVPSRENNPYSLLDTEVFYFSQDDLDARFAEYGDESEDENPFDAPGWYWWACFPGYLPDSDPIGPFATEQEAIDDAQSDSWQFENVSSSLLHFRQTAICLARYSGK